MSDSDDDFLDDFSRRIFEQRAAQRLLKALAAAPASPEDARSAWKLFQDQLWKKCSVEHKSPDWERYSLGRCSDTEFTILYSAHGWTFCLCITFDPDGHRVCWQLSQEQLGAIEGEFSIGVLDGAIVFLGVRNHGKYPLYEPAEAVSFFYNQMMMLFLEAIALERNRRKRVRAARLSNRTMLNGTSGWIQ
jgi:hypothetical protein